MASFKKYISYLETLIGRFAIFSNDNQHEEQAPCTAGIQSPRVSPCLHVLLLLSVGELPGPTGQWAEWTLPLPRLPCPAMSAPSHRHLLQTCSASVDSFQCGRSPISGSKPSSNASELVSTITKLCCMGARTHANPASRQDFGKGAAMPDTCTEYSSRSENFVCSQSAHPSSIWAHAPAP